MIWPFRSNELHGKIHLSFFFSSFRKTLGCYFRFVNCAENDKGTKTQQNEEKQKTFHT